MSTEKSAVLWSAIEKCATYVVNFSIQIILARLLCPEDYGVVAMLAVFLAVSQAFVDSGFATVLIQKQDCTIQDYTSVFYFNIIVSGVCYAVLFLSASYIERFYKFDGLALVTRVYFLNLIINSVAMVHRVILMKSLDFKKIALINLVSSIVSAITAVIMAYLNFRYWAIICQSLLSSLINTLFTMYLSHWHPLGRFNMESLRRMAPLGVKIMFASQFHAVYNNIYSLLIGKKYSPIDLGFYDRGKTLASTGAVGFSDFYIRALYPIQSKIQGDKEHLLNSYNKSFDFICLCIIPFSAFISSYSMETVSVIYGDGWQASANMLSILSIGFMFYPFQALNMNILKVVGNGDYLLYSEIIKKTIGIIIVIIMINFNLELVVIGWTVSAIVEFIISLFFLNKVLKGNLTYVVSSFFKSIIFSFSVMITSYWIFRQVCENMYVRLLLGMSCIFICFLLNINKLKKLLGK